MTYPTLRPSSESRLSGSLRAGSEAESTATGASSLSSHVRRALATALEMEALEAAPSPQQPANDPRVSTHSKSSVRPSAPIPEANLSGAATPVPSERRSRPASKLSQLAQSKAPRPVSSSSNTSQAAPLSEESDPKSSSSSSKSTRRAKSPAQRSTTTPLDEKSTAANHSQPQAPVQSRPLSKLAQLAQAKTQQSSPASSLLASQTSGNKPLSKLAQLAQAKQASPTPTQVPGVAASQTAGSSTSKLAQRAQLKTQESHSHPSSVNAALTKSDEAPASGSSSAKPTSKLAQLAQAKAQQGQQQMSWMPTPKRAPRVPLPGLMVHQSHTEYLTPIANGSTATTAITTTYQSLSGLSRPQRLEPSSQSVQMFASKPDRTPTEPKQSKLAMKSRKAHRQSEPEPEPEPAASLDPMFLPISLGTRASPSGFATLLVHEEEPVAQSKPPRVKERRTAREDKPKHKSSKRHEVPLPPGASADAQGFAFNIPSPDDIVFDARRGTSLGQRSSASSRQPPSHVTSSPSRASVNASSHRA